MKTLRRSMTVLAAIAAAVAALSCADSVGPTAAAPQVTATAIPPVAPSWFGLDFLSCTPIDADSVTQSVDSTGGTIFVGPHSVVIPEGALDTAVSITAVAPSDTINRLQLYPEGLQFAKKVSLKMSYANCDGISWLIPKRVAYVDSSFNVLDVLVSLDSWLNQRVTGKTDHFSDYVVAW